MSISAWADYLDARARLIQEWMRDGIPGEPRSRDNPTAIAVHLNRHDATQIHLIAITPLDPPQPCSSREALETLVCELQRTKEKCRGLTGHDHAMALADSWTRLWVIAAKRGL